MYLVLPIRSVQIVSKGCITKVNLIVKMCKTDLPALHLAQLICILEGIYLRIGEKTWLENIPTVSILQEF